MSSEKIDQTAMISESSANMPNYLTEEEKKINEDYEWCLNDRDVHRQYGGQVVVAHQRRIWGAGKDHRAAWDAAVQHPDCPHPRVCAFVVVPYSMVAPGEPSTSEG